MSPALESFTNQGFWRALSGLPPHLRIETRLPWVRGGLGGLAGIAKLKNLEELFLMPSDADHRDNRPNFSLLAYHKHLKVLVWCGASDLNSGPMPSTSLAGICSITPLEKLHIGDYDVQVGKQEIRQGYKAREGGPELARSVTVRSGN